MANRADFPAQACALVKRRPEPFVGPPLHGAICLRHCSSLIEIEKWRHAEDCLTSFSGPDSEYKPDWALA